MATLASQAEIGVWVQDSLAVLEVGAGGSHPLPLRGSRVSPPGKF